MAERITTEYGSTIFHVWDVHEYTKYPHTGRWYFVAATFLVACVAYALYTNNYLFAFIMLLITIIFVFHELREPAVTQFGITDIGIVWRGFLFPYKEVRSFWIIYEPHEGVQSLYFTFKKGSKPRLSISLEDQDPTIIRKTLRKFLFEDLSKEDEPLTDTIGRVLKF